MEERREGGMVEVERRKGRIEMKGGRERRRGGKEGERREGRKRGRVSEKSRYLYIGVIGS